MASKSIKQYNMDSTRTNTRENDRFNEMKTALHDHESNETIKIKEREREIERERERERERETDVRLCRDFEKQSRYFICVFPANLVLS